MNPAANLLRTGGRLLETYDRLLRQPDRNGSGSVFGRLLADPCARLNKPLEAAVSTAGRQGFPPADAGADGRLAAAPPAAGLRPHSISRGGDYLPAAVDRPAAESGGPGPAPAGRAEAQEDGGGRREEAWRPPRGALSATAFAAGQSHFDSRPPTADATDNRPPDVSPLPPPEEPPSLGSGFPHPRQTNGAAQGSPSQGNNPVLAPVFSALARLGLGRKEPGRPAAESGAHGPAPAGRVEARKDGGGRREEAWRPPRANPEVSAMARLGLGQKEGAGKQEPTDKPAPPRAGPSHPGQNQGLAPRPGHGEGRGQGFPMRAGQRGEEWGGAERHGEALEPHAPGPAQSGRPEDAPPPGMALARGKAGLAAVLRANLVAGESRGPAQASRVPTASAADPASDGPPAETHGLANPPAAGENPESGRDRSRPPEDSSSIDRLIEALSEQLELDFIRTYGSAGG